ncbi:MAG: hypothetical protein AAF502_24865 [Bacteroidota bacterium]
MKTNSKVGKVKRRKKAKAGLKHDKLLIQKSANTTIPDLVPNYTEMQLAIAEISHPVSFDALKKFYGLD